MAWLQIQLLLNIISSVDLLLHHTDAVAVLFLLVEGSAMLALSSHPTHQLPRSVCSCACMSVCVCFRKWCSASLCKFIHDRAETKISSLKQVRQPFGRHAPCLPCVRHICSGACPCSYYHFLCKRIEEHAAAYWEETNLHAGIFELEPTGIWFHMNECSLRCFGFFFFFLQ